ncbi:hypothetical protein [Halomonas sp. AOP42-D1-22]|uniref:hypothetical protein n=1 Tax=Halomonas sp. AOP42-D1-22 TaxID=3457667 RepID=UPI0040347AE3
MKTTITNDDRANIASAERVGNIRTLNKAVSAMDAVIDVLDSEYVSENPRLRLGLHLALSFISENLEDRAQFLMEQQEELGFGGEYGDE